MKVFKWQCCIREHYLLPVNVGSLVVTMVRIRVLYQHNSQMCVTCVVCSLGAALNSAYGQSNSQGYISYVENRIRAVGFF